MFSGVSFQVSMPNGELVDSHYEVHTNEGLSFLMGEMISIAKSLNATIEKVVIA